MKEIWDAQSNEELCLEFQQTKNNTLFEYFLSRNYGLIMDYIIPFLRKYPKQEEELKEECTLAMWEAMLKFDTNKQAKFSTYVHYYFKKNMWHYWHKQQIVKVPIYLLGKFDKVKAKNPNVVFEAESLNQTMYTSEDGSERTLEELVVDETEPSALDIIMTKEISELLLKLLDKLSPRESQCVQLYFGLNGYTPHTLQMIGEKYNVTRERIRQIIEKALLKIKRLCAKKGYHEEDF